MKKRLLMNILIFRPMEFIGLAFILGTVCAIMGGIVYSMPIAGAILGIVIAFIITNKL